MCFVRMIGDPRHMKQHRDEFLESLTPEEKAVHNRPDVKAAEEHVFKTYQQQAREKRKEAKLAKKAMK